MILFDQNISKGTKEFFSYDEGTDTTRITTVQDVSGLLDRLKDKRNVMGRDALKGEFWHYATIPEVVEIELRNKGIDIYNKDHTKALLKEINSNYAWLKATDKKHG
jgi:hypothetical protein